MHGHHSINVDETNEFILDDPIFLLPINGKLQGAARMTICHAGTRPKLAVRIETKNRG